MDKAHFGERENSLKYLIQEFENEQGWLNSPRAIANQASLGANAPALIHLGEALSTKRQAALFEYFEAWYRAFKDYEAVYVKSKIPNASSVRKAFRNRFHKDKASGDALSSLTSDVSSLSTFPNDMGHSAGDDHGIVSHAAPFPLDGRIVFLCLCQTVLAMYEAIQELATGEWNPQEKDLYLKLDNKIKSLVIDPGIRMMDVVNKPTKSQNVPKEKSTGSRFLRFGR